MTREPIAIVGIGCRFPGGVSDVDSFWRLLSNGTDAVSEVPGDRWSLTSFYDPDPERPGKTYARWGGFLDQIDQFDAQFFGISPREAAFMDPQQRLALETAWEALEDGGIAVEKLAGTNVGVFVGISTHDYGDIMIKGADATNFYAKSGGAAYFNSGGALSIAANRISYALNFCGPSIAIDTACSSALVATHIACHSLWEGESTVAIAGGVNIIINPDIMLSFSKAAMLSRDGHCHTFDAGANGYVRGEGAGMVVLKPLSRARSDRDRIYAVIRNTGVNQDGRTTGMTVPNMVSQEALLRHVYGRAKIKPEQVLYVEAHGTGTPVGDPIEANAIGRVLGAPRRDGSVLRVGSVKTNIGHLEAAAGVAGLIKAALMIKRRALPPSLNFEEPNPAIPFEALHLEVQRVLAPWPLGAPSVIGVNSFGFGGTNAHAVLDTVPPMDEPSAGERPRASYLAPVSARRPEALSALADSWREALDGAAGGEDICLGDLAYTAGQRRSHHEYRAALTVSTFDELRAGLAAVTQGVSLATLVTGRALTGLPPRVGFIFSGMGPQWWAMGRCLLEQEPVFFRTVEECDAIFRRYAGWSILEELLADEAGSRMGEAEVAQPANFVLQVGLARLLDAWGVCPAGIVGHSAGEVAAACVAGALSLEDAVRVIYQRSRLQQQATNRGRMLALGMSGDEATTLVEGREGEVSVAVLNSPASATLSGDRDAIEKLAAQLQERGVFARVLDVNVPYHSHHMEPLRNELLECLAGLEPSRPAIPLYSTALGELLETPMDAEYWWTNVRHPVRFQAALDLMIDEGFDAFIELAPHPVLARSVVEVSAARGEKPAVLPTLRRDQDDRRVLLRMAATLYSCGQPLDWRAINGEGRLVSLPGYPWQRERYWGESPTVASYRMGENVHPLLGRPVASPHPTWSADLDGAALLYLTEHRVQGTAVYPAAAYIEMAVASARQLSVSGGCVIEGFKFKRALSLIREDYTELRLTYGATEASIDIHSRPLEGSSWTWHARARLSQQSVPSAARIDVERLKRRFPNLITGAESYRLLAGVGLEYGPRFKGITQIWQGNSEALGRISFPAETAPDTEGYSLHPAILDSCLQVLVGTVVLPDGIAPRRKGTYLPVEIDRVRYFGRQLPTSAWSHVKLTHLADASSEGDIIVFDDAGERIIELLGFRCRLVPDTRASSSEASTRFIHNLQWFARELPAVAASRRAGHLPSPEELAAGTEVGREDDRRRYYEDFEPRLDSLCGDYIVEALKKLGWRPRRGQRLTTESLAAELAIAAEHRRELGRLLDVLAEDGVVRRGDEGWTVLRGLPRVDASGAARALTDAFPDYEGVLRLLRRSASQLAEVLRGETEPLQLLFPDGSMADVTHLYEDSPLNLSYNRAVAEAVGAIVGRMAGDSTLRVLEIGAGTGGTTSHLLPLLPPNRTEYYFTDVSPAFTSSARLRFRAYPFLYTARLDIEEDPTAQGFASHSFDVVIAADVLHATPDLHHTLANVRRLLAPGGLLVLLELTSPSRYLDLTFGLLKDWWSFADSALRPSLPMIHRAAWQTVMEESGFQAVTPVSEQSVGRAPFQTLFLARSPVLTAGSNCHVAAPREGTETLATLVVASRMEQASGICRILEARGAPVVLATAGDRFARSSAGHCVVRLDGPADLTSLLVDLAASQMGLRRVIYIAGDADELSPESLAADMNERCVALLSIAQALGSAPVSQPPRLYVVARGTQQVGDRPAPSRLAEAPLWGLGRVIMNEYPHLECTLLDLDPDAGAQDETIVAEICADDEEHEIAFRGSSRYVARVLRAADVAAKDTARREANRGAGLPFELIPARPGILDSLELQERPRRRPKAGEVEVEVHAAGLNFRDVMKAMGVYPSDKSDASWLGDECAGRVVRVGRDVTAFKAGDEVMAMADGSLRSHVTVSAERVMVKAPSLTFEQAATIPLVFMTTHLALNHHGGLRRGERILIHSAAGGVGMAAIQLATLAGAEVLATAGSEEKREFLRSLGIKHVMDSRSLTFADETMRATRGAGVDVVLNSLAGEFIPKGISVLRPGGRFLELGRVDIYQDSKLGLSPFRAGLSFIAVDLSLVLDVWPDLAKRLYREIVEMFADGRLQPLPVTPFSISEAGSAFRYMAQAKHIGKIALTLDSRESIPVVRARKQKRPFKANAAYLVSGGLGGFGLAVARWMVAKGASNLVLVGRSGANSAEAIQTVEQLRRAGARVEVARVDVSNRAAVERLMANICDTLPPLRGVFHAAMVLDDGYLLQLDGARFERVMAPKAGGAWNLHLSTLDKPLDHFVMFSSTTSLVGTPGQANYAAANAFLDSLAYYRRGNGLPGLTVNWGAITDTGYVARNPEVARQLERIGLHGLPAAEALALLEEFLGGDVAQVGVMRFDASILRRSHSDGAKQRFSLMIEDEENGGVSGGDGRRGNLLAALRSIPEGERLATIESHLAKEMARVLQIPTNRLDPDMALSDLGLDSLISVEIETVLELELGVKLPLGYLVGSGVTVRVLARRLLDGLAWHGASASESGAHNGLAPDAQLVTTNA